MCVFGWDVSHRSAAEDVQCDRHIVCAMQVVALRQENERLKASLAGLLSSPLNSELQLPPTLLLR